jgi:hypothetical protein
MGVQVVPEHQRLLERLAIHAYIFVGIGHRVLRRVPSWYINQGEQLEAKLLVLCDSLG